VDTADGLRFHWYSADHPLDVTRHYYATTGAVRLPAPWALGPWLWRDESRDQAEVEADIATLRALDLATSGIWIDRPYATGVNTFDFDPAKYEDPSALIARAHAAGLRVALWHTPYADPESAPDFYAVADSQGYFPPAAPPPFTWSLPLDFTNPDARAWWQQWIDAYTMLGIEGYKLDYAEDVLVVGSAGGRLPWSFFDGSDERTMHSKYQLLYHEVYAETLPSEGGFLLTRTARYGDQANGVIVWPGDIDADLSSFGEVVTDDHGDTYGAVGGLPSAVVASVSLGPSGLPFFGSDTGGYRHAPPTKETFTRWFQHTALSTVMQVGTNANDLPWEGGRDDEPFDAEMLGWYRDYARLHLRLWPYLWTHAAALESTGRPILRPVGFAFPELGQHPPHDYLVGDDLLVAPVVVAGARTRDVVVPPGAWIDWFTGDVLTGPGGAHRGRAARSAPAVPPGGRGGAAAAPDGRHAVPSDRSRRRHRRRRQRRAVGSDVARARLHVRLVRRRGDRPVDLGRGRHPDLARRRRVRRGRRRRGDRLRGRLRDGGRRAPPGGRRRVVRVPRERRVHLGPRATRRSHGHPARGPVSGST
jgi:alpha-D-xyloside xylohydrolase